MYWCVERCLESKALGLNFMLLRLITFLLLIYGSPNNLIPVTSQVLSDPHSIFNYPRHQHAATCLKNIRLNERWGKKLDINLLNKQPLNAVYRHSLLEITHEKKIFMRGNVNSWLLKYIQDTKTHETKFFFLTLTKIN